MTEWKETETTLTKTDSYSDEEQFFLSRIKSLKNVIVFMFNKVFFKVTRFDLSSTKQTNPVDSGT